MIAKIVQGFLVLLAVVVLDVFIVELPLSLFISAAIAGLTCLSIYHDGRIDRRFGNEE